VKALSTKKSDVPSESACTAMLRVGFFLSVAFLGFVAGSYAMFSEAWPARYLTEAYRGGEALFAAKTQYNSPYPSGFWERARTQDRGVTIYNPAKALNGYTLFTSGEGQRAALISMTGEVLHEWQLPFSEIWDDTAQVKDPRPDSMIHYRSAYLYPNGDLLAIYEAVGDTPWGYGLAKMDKDSRLIWKYLEGAHHDLDVAPDGNIYVLTHEIRNTIINNWRHLKPPHVDDFVVVLSPDGKVLKKVSVLDALVASPYARMVNTVAWYSKDDYVHANAVDVVDEQAAMRLAGMPGHQVLVSMRELGAIGLLDLDREVFTWALRGSWAARPRPAAERQHPALRQLWELRSGRHLARDRVQSKDPRAGLELHGRRPEPVAEQPPLRSGAACEWQHADHRVGRRSPDRGDAGRRARVGVCRSHSGWRRGRVHPGRVRGTAHRCRKAGSKVSRLTNELKASSSATS
jgi:hypothetical protein